MEKTPRQRYLARRKAVAARRRRFAIILVLLFSVVVVLAMVLWPRPASAPEASPAPTSAAVAALPAVATLPASPPPAASQPATFFHAQRLTYEPNFFQPEIQAFLENQPGMLKNFSAPVGGQPSPLSEIILGQSLYYSLNPKVVLALLESQGDLLSNPSPSPEQLDWALGYHTPDTKPEDDKRKGLPAQIRWAVRQLLYARRDAAGNRTLEFADKSTATAPADWELGRYALARALAPATTPEQLETRLQAFETTYTELFGDPRAPLAEQPGLAQPFLEWPLEHPARVTSFFDHDGPFLSGNGGTFSYWGQNETDLSYDGHDGWDYAAFAPDRVLAAAAGAVIFAGNADDNCGTTAVVLDHGNGYRTLYWHLSAVSVRAGQVVEAGQPIGVVGASGCALGEHLHLGVQYLGRNVDPYGYCGSNTDPWLAAPSGATSVWLWNDRPSPCAAPPANAILVDTDSSGFAVTGVWQQASYGYGGGALFAHSVGPPPTAVPEPTEAADASSQQPTALPDFAERTPTATASYRPVLPAPGRYRVMAYVPYYLNGLDDAIGITYRVQYSGGETQITVDMQEYANEWIDLGAYQFDPASAEVSLDNRASADDQGVWADALLWLPEP